MTLHYRAEGRQSYAVLLFAPSSKPFDLFERLRINETLFPRGIDLVLVADDAVVAIPRTTRVVSKGS